MTERPSWRERAEALEIREDDYLAWFSLRHRQHLLLAVEVAGRDQGGWANCHEVCDVLRRNRGAGPPAHDPAFLSVSVLAAWCRASYHNDPATRDVTPALLEKRRRIGAGLVDYRLTDDGRELMKRGMSVGS